MNLQLQNRVALVTAASQGLGYATALELSREGASVAIVSRDQGRLAAAVDSIRSETKSPVIGIQGDVTRREDIERMVERTVEEYGGLDILVTNCGGPPAARFDDISEEMWYAAIDLVFMSAVRLIKASLPHLRQSPAPAVLAVTSIAVKQPQTDLILSNSVRLAVIGLIKSLALELGSEGIRFNSILPGFTETERINDLLSGRAQRNNTTVDEEITKAMAGSPMGRMASPEEFAQVAAFLCSPMASYLNGNMISIDGGMYRGIF